MTFVSIRKLLLGCAVGFALAGADGVSAQEHSYAPSDIENGRGLYQANCLGCHGNNGDSVEGANLASGRFRRASSDEDLMTLIRTGIPETLMIPRPQFSYGELRSLVAFLRSMQTGGALTAQDAEQVDIGDASRGEELFFSVKGQCGSCHGVNGGGSRLYPDLGGIGSQRSAAFLQESILDPRAVVREGQRFYQVTTTDGNVVSGKVMNRDTHSVQLLNDKEQLVSYREDEISEKGFIPTPMPAYLDVLSSDDVADLVAYLLTLTTAEQQ
jgi:putative heme-binding domain-containing protein